MVSILRLPTLRYFALLRMTDKTLIVPELRSTPPPKVVWACRVRELTDGLQSMDGFGEIVSLPLQDQHNRKP